ncbi:hypothetical protein ANCDUO_15631 [Ancylostoma duodenale]|uniref:Uncharacterized protein n=1 Tax=Ancylostoma duodenale TaxID=51022 RepID=A0A0C2CD17_9BILA|nr:hypothetical protein ANCDUO_15631 [Ancylostoma duodenale]
MLSDIFGDFVIDEEDTKERVQFCTPEQYRAEIHSIGWFLNPQSSKDRKDEEERELVNHRAAYFFNRGQYAEAVEEYKSLFHKFKHSRTHSVAVIDSLIRCALKVGGNFHIGYHVRALMLFERHLNQAHGFVVDVLRKKIGRLEEKLTLLGYSTDQIREARLRMGIDLVPSDEKAELSEDLQRPAHDCRSKIGVYKTADDCKRILSEFRNKFCWMFRVRVDLYETFYKAVNLNLVMLQVRLGQGHNVRGVGDINSSCPIKC